MVEIFNKIMNEIDKYETVIIHRHVRLIQMHMVHS